MFTDCKNPPRGVPGRRAARLAPRPRAQEDGRITAAGPSPWASRPGATNDIKG